MHSLLYNWCHCR